MIDKLKDFDGIPIRLLSPLETYFTLLKGFVCSGFLYLPRAFVVSGWLYSTLTLIFIGALTLYTQILFLQAREKVKARSMSDLAYRTIGWPGKVLTDVLVFVT